MWGSKAGTSSIDPSPRSTRPKLLCTFAHSAIQGPVASPPGTIAAWATGSNSSWRSRSRAGVSLISAYVRHAWLMTRSAAIADAESDDGPCDFCGRIPAAGLEALLGPFVAGLRTEFGDADDEGVFWDGDDGGYQWHETWDTWDLVLNHAEVLIGNGLAEAVAQAIDDRTWVRRNFVALRRDAGLSAGWDRFRQAVMYETRYVFWLRPESEAEHQLEPGEVAASRILDEVGSLIEELGLVRTIPAGYALWRAHAHGQEPLVAHTASRLGTAPHERSRKANRMSPAGIPLFYGAGDVDTAILEVAVHAPTSCVTVARFITSRPCLVIDFTELPPVPSMFDFANGHMRRPTAFLHSFVADLAAPARANFEQIDHVPTQVMTEYLLRIRFGGGQIAGLLYPSAMNGRMSAVLDVKNDDCVDLSPSWDSGSRLRLGLVRESAFTRDPPDDHAGRADSPP